MQDIGSKEDTELSREDLYFRWRELSVESPGRCQSVGNWMFFPRGFARNEEPKSVLPRLPPDILSNFLSLEEHPVSKVSVAWSFAEALNHSA
jgi:hypothetical protein